MLCAENARHGTAYTSAAQAAARSIEKVIRAESYLRDAAISLGQEEEMATLINELYEVGGALRDCCGKVSDKRVSDRAERARQAESHARDIDSIKPALPQWWFALSEMLQVTEREIEFLKTIGRGQPRESEARRLCNLVIRVLRRHYQSMLAEADEWMSAADV